MNLFVISGWPVIQLVIQMWFDYCFLYCYANDMKASRVICALRLNKYKGTLFAVIVSMHWHLVDV
jgi:hypothetical protein